MERPGASPRLAHAQALFDGAAMGYDRMSRLLSCGQYDRWTRALVEAAAEGGVAPGYRVLDLATGTGLVAEGLVRRTGCRVVGADQSQGMLAAARARKVVRWPNGAEAGTTGGGEHGRLESADATRGAGTQRRRPQGTGGTKEDALEGARLGGNAKKEGGQGVEAARYDLARATADHLPFPDDAFDAATFTYLLRYVDDPTRTLREIARVVKPGGFVGMVEFHVPPQPWRLAWQAHTRVVLPLAGRMRSKGWRQVGDFLGPSIEEFWADRTAEDIDGAFRDVGLTDVHHRLLSLGGGILVWGRKEDA